MTATLQIRRPATDRSLLTRAARPVSGASLAVFRVLFGLAATYGAIRFLARGWVDALYLQPAHHLTYPGFDWVQPLPGPLMHALFVLLAVAGLCIAAGYRYRLFMAVYAVAFTYAELIEAALYLNHYWWVTSTAFVLVFLPLHRMWSWDARAGRVAPSPTVPSWVLWCVQGLIAVVYVFAGLAKLQPDWLWRAQPMSLWLADRTHVPVVGGLLDEPMTAYIASWAGAAFDCTIVGWLLWRKSRPFAYAAVVAFHLATAMLFQIGMFPWLMILVTLVFFSPDWPVRAARRVGLNLPVPAHQSATSHSSKVPVVALLLLAVIQLVLPLRHYAYPGDVRWTEEGYYAAWRVMLTEKAGTAEFRVDDPRTAQRWTISPGQYLTDWQVTQATTRPDLLLTTAHLIADDFRRAGHPDVRVYADAFATMNGRPFQPLVNPSVDLAAITRGPGHKPHVTPVMAAS